MKRLKILLFVIVTACFFCHAQNLDSLWKVYKNTTQADTNRLTAIYNIARAYMGNNPDTAISLAEQQLKFAQKAKQKNFEGKALTIIGASYMNKGDYPTALEYYFKALQVLEKTGNKKDLGNCYGNMGVLYINQANYTKALEHYFKALQLKEEIGDKRGVGLCYNNIGNVYLYQFKNLLQNPKALEYYLKALKIFEEIGNKQGIAACYGNIGIVYKEQANYPKALAYYLKDLKIAEEIGDNHGIAECYINMGDIYDKQFNNAKALEYYLKGLKIKEEIGDRQGIGACYVYLGILYNKLANFKMAILSSDSALQITKEVGDIDKERITYQNFATAYEKTGRYKDAYKYYVLFKLLTDSIFNAENSRQLGDMKTNFEVEKKEAELKIKAEAQEVLNAEEKQKQKIIIYAVAGVLLIVIVFSVFLYRRFKITKKQKYIIELQKDEVSRQKTIVEKQKHLVEEHQKEIIDSITYAKRLQQAILPSAEEIKKYLPDNFIYYQPKDIVAGDFYWMEHFDGTTYIAAADSTGHGVPGAMVSVVCSNALNRSVKEFGLRDTGKILDKTRELVLETFEKSGEEIKDGMDISLLSINKSTHEVFWSGANNQLWYIKKEGITMVEIKADKQPIGKTDNPKPFTTHILDLQQGDIVYLMTDGYPDQFGGEKGKKYKYKQLEEKLVANSVKELDEQKQILSKSFDDWKNDLEQVDDVTIIGIKL